MDSEDTMARDKQIWSDLFVKQLNMSSVLLPMQEFVNENFAHPLNCRMAAFVEFKDSVKERVKEFKRVPATPKKKRQDRDNYKITLEEFASNLQRLNLDDSEVNEIMQYENVPARARSETRTPDLDILEKKKSKSVFPTSATPKLPPSAVKASRVRVGSVSRTPVTRSMAARLAGASQVSTPVTSRNPHLTSTPGSSRTRTTNDRRILKEQSEMKLECASINRDERLREDVERKRREREDRERRVQLNLKEKKRAEEKKQEKVKERERLVEQLRVEQLNATKKAAASPSRVRAMVQSPARAMAQSPSRAYIVPNAQKSHIPRFERPTAASKAKTATSKGPVAKFLKHGEQHETASKIPAHMSAASSMESVFSNGTEADEKEAKRRADAEARILRQQQREELARQKKLAKEEALRKKAAEKEEQDRRAAEEERKRIAELKAEEEERKRAAVEEAARKRAAEEEKRRPQEAKVAKGTLKTPLLPKNSTVASEYDMTPDKVYKESSETNYNIEDLSSGDETDDDENPRKKVPYWAQSEQIARAAKDQAKLDPQFADRLFPPLVVPELGDIFGRHPSRYPQRTSSAHWQSPLEAPKIGRSRMPAKRKLHSS
ncbi:hypothetical protein QR680_008869 [Steinernema hermaphroditum]|uniref:Inner centromere protein ARK-binding domain-containing protein n=1 Tax=Steinernema hermaphroditum TaxID=289476 RepID=A0AA39M8W3_9BILA|nr:hypothetical protein QR680_008869 [Steinernema hermaphroditum]